MNRLSKSGLGQKGLDGICSEGVNHIDLITFYLMANIVLVSMQSLCHIPLTTLSYLRFITLKKQLALQMKWVFATQQIAMVKLT